MATGKRQSKLRIFQVILVFLLLSLLIFLLGTETARVASEVGKEAVRTETLTETLDATGYLFRTEVPVTDINGGAVHYLLASGAAVASGTALAEVYRADSGVNERARAAALYEEIELLEAALSSDEQTWQVAYWRANEAVSAAASRGDVSAAAHAAKLVQLALLREDAAKNHVFFEARIKECEAQLAQLTQHVGAPNTVTAPVAGVFHRGTDGYEALFAPNAAAGLTPEGLSALLASKPTSTDGVPDAVGKVVPEGRCLLAVCVKEEDARFLRTGEEYHLSIFEGDASRSALVTLQELNYSADKSEVLLLFGGAGMEVFSQFGRVLSVRIAGDSLTGLSVPETAMRVENNRDGVYVLAEGRAAWRPVKILYRANGCCLVEAVSSAEAPERPMLREGDTLVVTSRRLYEGKVLN